ncbi:hypothetical protein HDU93_001179 [Gonapodya sp. JEL0774]|nr:hypothetical protein HDU93_001179 [Gonapodya sp. JEL0774]
MRICRMWPAVLDSRTLGATSENIPFCGSTISLRNRSVPEQVFSTGPRPEIRRGRPKRPRADTTSTTISSSSSPDSSTAILKSEFASSEPPVDLPLNTVEPQIKSEHLETPEMSPSTSTSPDASASTTTAPSPASETPAHSQTQTRVVRASNGPERAMRSKRRSSRPSLRVQAPTAAGAGASTGAGAVAVADASAPAPLTSAVFVADPDTDSDLHHLDTEFDADLYEPQMVIETDGNGHFWAVPASVSISASAVSPVSSVPPAAFGSPTSCSPISITSHRTFSSTSAATSPPGPASWTDPMSTWHDHHQHPYLHRQHAHPGLIERHSLPMPIPRSSAPSRIPRATSDPSCIWQESLGYHQASSFPPTAWTDLSVQRAASSVQIPVPVHVPISVPLAVSAASGAVHYGVGVDVDVEHYRNSVFAAAAAANRLCDPTAGSFSLVQSPQTESVPFMAHHYSSTAAPLHHQSQQQHHQNHQLGQGQASFMDGQDYPLADIELMMNGELDLFAKMTASARGLSQPHMAFPTPSYHHPSVDAALSADFCAPIADRDVYMVHDPSSAASTSASASASGIAGLVLAGSHEMDLAGLNAVMQMESWAAAAYPHLFQGRGLELLG